MALRPKQFFFEENAALISRAPRRWPESPPRPAATYERLLKDAPETRRGDDLKTHLANLKSRPGK